MNNKLIIKGFRNQLYLDFNRNIFWNNKKEEALSDFSGLHLNSNFQQPCHISNVIIQIDNHLDSISDVEKIFELIEKLQCKYVVFDIKYSINVSTIENLVLLVNKYNIHEVTFLLQYNDSLHIDNFENVFDLTDRIKAIVIYESKVNKNFSNVIFYYTKKRKVVFKKNKQEFFLNKYLFHESVNFNTYFNKKLYIGPNGEIKNAPECEETFGFIQDIQSAEELKEIIAKKIFQKYWFVHKEITDVCKDCEFRHMCVDNRLPYQRAENEWYHKIECNYNPYICKWEDEEGYETLEECGVKSDENGFSIDHERIAEINEVLWGEG